MVDEEIMVLLHCA